MRTASLASEQVNEAIERVNEAIEQFANNIMQAFGITDEEASEPELTGTSFKVIDIDGEERIMNAENFNVGTLIAEGPFEYFRVTVGVNYPAPWIRYSGSEFNHAEFAEEMRLSDILPRIIHHG